MSRVFGDIPLGKDLATRAKTCVANLCPGAWRSDPALGLESPRRGPGMYGGGAREADVWGFILLKQQSCAVFLWAGRMGGEPCPTRSFQTN